MSDLSGLPPGFELQDDPGAPPITGNENLPAGFEMQPDLGAPPGPVSMAPAVNPYAIAAKTVGNDVLGAVETVGTGIVNAPHAAISAVDNLLQHAGGVENPQPTSALEVTPTPRAQEFMQAVGQSPLIQNPVSQAAISKWRQESQAHPVISDVASDIANLLPAAGMARGLGALKDSLSAVPEVAGTASRTAEENLAAQAAASKGNMGAAAAPPSLEGVSLPLRQAIANAKNVDPDALARQIDADTLPQPDGVTPIRLRAGSALADDGQISLERNLRSDPATNGLLEKSISENDAKLGSSLGEIRRRATPDIVQRSNVEHGQAAIDAIKDRDNAAVTDIRAKYQALADQNGGAMPIDAGATVGTIDDTLSKGFLTKTAAEDPVVSEVMDSLRSGKPITFEQFENARTNLAAVQRSGTPAARAAAIVRGGLENMPLSNDASNLKELADSARAAARARFNTIEQNPAYEAVINDNVPSTPTGLHVVGAPSPLADSFMDRYFLGNGQSASAAYIARLQRLMQPNPDFASTVEAASLNKLRKAAGLDENDEGTFRAPSYRNARDAMAPKASVLMSPQSAQWTEQLKRVAGYENGVGKAGTVNTSNTGAALRQLAGEPPASGVGTVAAQEVANHATDLLAAHTPLGVGLVAKRFGLSMMKNAKAAKTAAAKLKFAQDATTPGAGIDRGPSPATVGLRASGGRVDHEVLVSRLMDRWHAARKSAKKTTEPLLSLPDATIQRALQITARPPV